MERLLVECLNCGHVRALELPKGKVLASGECERCSYVGWAPHAELTEKVRRSLRDVPVAFRGAYRSAA